MKLSIIISGFLVISVCGSEFNVCYPRKHNDFDSRITLFSTLDMDHMALNDKFERIASEMGFTVYIVALHTNGDGKTLNAVNDTILNASLYPWHVINLNIYTKDLLSNYETYQKFLNSNLFCATDCENYNISRYTRLVSDTLFNHPQLLQIIRSEDLELRDYIQICLPRNSPNLTPKILEVNQNLNWLLRVEIDNCASNFEPDSSILAMITNEPSETDSLLPTIFYRTLYNLPEVTDRFPNSLSLSTTWHFLKYAFKEFLKNMGWYRVAILSDDSTYSLDFLEELVPLLKNEGMTIANQKCSERFCNFNNPLKFLKAADSRIIILNVDKRNARKLVDTINNLNMAGVVWIVREWPFDELKTNIMSDVFSIFLAPSFNKEDKFYPYLSSIKASIKKIDCIYKSVLGDKEKFRREFAKEATRRVNFKTNAYITRIHKHSGPTLLASMTIAGEVTEYFHFTSSYKGRIPPDTPESCIVRSKNFFRPCSHEELLLLVCVCVMFALSLLVIIVCFNKYRTSRYYNRFS